MPTVALHSHYWSQKTHAPEAPPDVGTSVDGGYVPWQTTVTFGSGFGVMQVAWERMVATMKERRDGDV